jgi:triosephosphate isomerase
MKTVIGNWKMNVGVRESIALARGTLLTLRGRKVVPHLIICPSFIALSEVRKVIARSSVSLCAQNMSWEDKGAFTGEISSRMLDEVGVTHVLIGHSERRGLFSETDEIVNRKLKKALENNLTPIVCIGESVEHREGGGYLEIIKNQIASALGGIRLRSSAKLFIAYEPIWAIGTGKNADVAQVIEVHEFIKTVLSDIFPGIKEDQLNVLYGGSVNGDNAYALLREKSIDGVLVGGASVKINQFKDVIEAASEVLEAQE